MRHVIRLWLLLLAFAAMPSRADSCVPLSQWLLQPADTAILHSIEVDAGELFMSTAVHSQLDEFIEKSIDTAKMEMRLEELRSLYYSRGYFHISISTCLKPSEEQENYFDLFVHIRSGERAFIRSIDFHGVNKVPKGDLEIALQSKPCSALTMILGTMNYDRLELDDDKARIIEYYQTQGFLDARVVDIIVKAADDLSYVDVRIAIDEGEPYRIGKIAFSGDLPKGESSESFRSKIALKDGEIFDLPKLTEEVERLLIPLKDQGFALAKATPELKIEKGGKNQTQLLSVHYRLEKSERVIIRDVIAKGQELTKEHVITREFSGIKGKIYHQSQIEAMRLKLMATGIFSEAKLSLSKTKVEGLYDLVVTIKEGFPLRFNLSPYYLAGEGLIVSAYVLHQNLLGLGVYGAIYGQISSLRQAFELSLYEPRVSGKKLSWLSEVHHRQLGYFSFSSRSLGGGMRSFWRLSEKIFLGMGINVDDVSVIVNEPALLYRPWVQIPEGNTRSAVFLSATLQAVQNAWDEYQNLLMDMRVTYAGPLSLSELESTELSGGIRWGFALAPFVFRGRLSAGVLLQTGSRPLPITDRYFLGGQANLRGYATRAVGPWVQSQGARAIQIGGVSKITQTIEIEFPITKFLEMRGYAFTDMGNAYAENQRFLLEGIAASIGFGLFAKLWRLPFKFEFALPVVKMPGALPFDFYVGLSSST